MSLNPKGSGLTNFKITLLKHAGGPLSRQFSIGIKAEYPG